MSGTPAEPPYLSVVIPCYDEEERIGGTLARIQDYLAQREESMEIVVVDDGSRDATREIVQRAAAEDETVRLLRVERNRGKGAACAHGFRSARGRRVLLCDADLSTPIEEVASLEAALDAGGELAIGSRGLAGSAVVVHQPWWRETMGRTFNLLVRSITGLRVRDSQCGFKLLEREACTPLFSLNRVRGFAFDVELLVIARRHGLTWHEVPVRWYDSPESRVQPIRHSLQMLRDILRVKWWELCGSYEPSREPHERVAG